MRRLAACAVVAIALAVYLHRKTHLVPCGLGFDKPVCAVRSSWQDPVALLVGVTGIAVALAVILVAGRRFVARNFRPRTMTLEVATAELKHRLSERRQ